MKMILKIFSLIIFLLALSACHFETTVKSKKNNYDYLDSTIQKYFHNYSENIDVISDKESSELLAIYVDEIKITSKEIIKIKENILKDGWIYKGNDGVFETYCLGGNQSLTMNHDIEKRRWTFGLYYTKYGVTDCM